MSERRSFQFDGDAISTTSKTNNNESPLNSNSDEIVEESKEAEEEFQEVPTVGLSLEAAPFSLTTTTDTPQT